MSDIVQYRPGALEAAEASLMANLNNMRQHSEERIHTGVQFINESSGQFTQRFEEVNNQRRHVQEEQAQVIHQIIDAVREAKLQNAARDARSAASI